jgi:RNA polymerase sigma-70 factor (ECF subfamily)
MQPHPTAESAARDCKVLFDEHGSSVYRFAVVMLRHHQDAEDVLQETFLKLLSHLRGGGTSVNLRGWLFTVAANAARDRLRRRTRWIPWAPAHDVAVPAAFDAEDEDGRRRTVRLALDALSARDRLLLALRAQGLSYREIAAASGIRETSVGRLLARAVHRWGRASSRVPHNEKGMDVYELSERRQNSGGRR